MSITLDQILALVGKLDDASGQETPRERFRKFLKENLLEVGRIRDYVEECLRNSGDQYNRALQDLINHIGRFLGFEVSFGRYHGIQGEIGFDGLWFSPKEFYIVVEVKTTETYAIKTSTFMDYVNRLISDKKISDWDHAMGLYVIGRPDPEIRQLENAIIAEKRTDQLRIISVGSLLALAEMMTEYDVAHEDIMAILRPSGPTIDPVVDLMARLVSEEKEEEQVTEVPSSELQVEGEAAYWLTPVRSDETCTAEECIETLVGQAQIYAFGDRTPGRKHLKPGDWICFYASGKGIVAHAKVSSVPAKKPDPRVHHTEKYPWTFNLEDSYLYIDEPIIIDATIRAQLDYFKGRDLNKPWAWFVQATRRITKHDFEILTRR
jgi:hypothetical protein